MAAIDVGYHNTSVNWNAAGDKYTRINLGNPANDSGNLSSVQFVTDGITGLIAGVFYLISGTTYRDRDSASLGDFTSGSHTVTGLSIEVSVDDVIGYYHNTGYLKGRSDVTGNVLRYISGNVFGTNTNYTGAVTGYAFCLYATGETVAAGAIPQMLACI